MTIRTKQSSFDFETNEFPCITSRIGVLYLFNRHGEKLMHHVIPRQPEDIPHFLAELPTEEDRQDYEIAIRREQRGIRHSSESGTMQHVTTDEPKSNVYNTRLK